MRQILGVWMLVMMTVALLNIERYHCCLEEERSGLLEIKAWMNHPDGTSMPDWVENTDCCKWTGVECDNTTKRVARLDLSFQREFWRLGDLYLNASLFLPFKELQSLELIWNGLVGFLENQGFEVLASGLRKLKKLDLGGNSFTDSILSSLPAVSSLQNLDLSFNMLTTISTSIRGLRQLVDLDLSGNQLSDSSLSPLSGLSSLQTLHLSHNRKLAGSTSIAGLKNLDTLYLDGIDFKESVLIESLAELPSLKTFYARRSNLSRALVGKDGDSRVFRLFGRDPDRAELGLLCPFMEGFGFSDASSAVRKKRSNTSRRPRNDSHTPSDYIDVSSLSSTPPSETVSKVSSDDNNDCGSISRKKKVSLILCSSRASSTNLADCESAQNMMKNEDGGFGESDEASNNCSFRGSNEQRHSGVDSRRSSEGVLAPANWKSTSGLGHVGGFPDGVGNEGKVKKVKLKVGGVTRTINAKSASDGASAVGSSSSKASRFPDPRQKLIEENLDDNRSFTSGKGSGLRGVPWKDFSRSGLNVGKVDGLRVEDLSSKQTDQYEPVRKSKRVPKKRLLEGVLDDGGEDDDEIRYLEKVKTSKISTNSGAEFEDEDGGSRKQRKISRVLKRNVDVLYDVDAGDHGSSRFGKEGKKSKSGRVSVDTDYMEDEELGSDGDPTSRRKKPRKELADLSVDSKKEMTVTTRQRALQTGKEASPGFASLIEFPNGLPPAPPKKQKEKLTEVEQQLKRAEALQRRRMQVEKANRESEAEAIRKILGQDSTRKKREDKLKKRQEEMAQEKAANAMLLPSDHVRWVIGPSGTTVTFPNEMGLPSIFDSKSYSYPPPREKCAAPSCTNPYKYRDSKSKLPLCSLQCYKAIHEKIQPLTAC
ncbi:unnamed protein product [Dovyalis caffra]|uniref:INO80 complex subunit B-like conserved region domain-containing protein n=1 Tax=Dovyalis caffra TaxID=77055 RepID=A0AAV1RWA7_9ROSI|nr:unnamed protein product [Dovyalis caffra]